MAEIDTDAIKRLLADPSISRKLFDEMLSRLKKIAEVN